MISKAAWTAQVLVACVFLFAGAMKFVIPIEQMTAQLPLPGWFLYFIGTAEILGAIGLIVPSLLRVRPQLTPIAAAGLIVIMIGATAITIKINGVGPAIVPFVVGVLCAFIAYARWRLAPIVPRSEPSTARA